MSYSCPDRVSSVDLLGSRGVDLMQAISLEDMTINKDDCAVSTSVDLI